MRRIVSFVFVILLLVLLFCGLQFFAKSKEESKIEIQQLVTPTPTAIPNVIIVYVTPVPTAAVTATPTIEPTSLPTEFPTNNPTEIPTNVPTQEPTNVPTEVPTNVPTQEPTNVPTEVPTNVPTQEPTNVPTGVPTSIPTQVPTSVPTEDMSMYYEQFKNEMSTLTISGGIYPDYTSSAKYDLYDYISVNNLDSATIFSMIRVPFENGIARWTAMDFTSSGSALNRLSHALESSICNSCGRVKLGDYSQNVSLISAIFSEIEQTGEYGKANQLLLDYIYKYTLKNPSNPHERLFVVCSE